MFPSVGLEFFVKYSATSLFYGASHGGLQKRHLSVYFGVSVKLLHAATVFVALSNAASHLRRSRRLVVYAATFQP